ncbi:ADP-ribosylation factor protein 3 [Coelomomyces lativittatus]|nr:ADP-ribosylation factor protein 3 [Coelomomyces lativittatus]KAJ1499797.1 ADP-ribosylation factor protein 3 [Coelomomyces lativittatus]KAJ1499891.1 ADP-ribosylation factor protein 3 [Coelomomyces lativittatus]
MYTLLTGLYKQWTQKETFHVLLLGLDNAGKTTLLERIKTLFSSSSSDSTSSIPSFDTMTTTTPKVVPTIGLNIGQIQLHHLLLQFWDVGGQVDLHRIWEKYYSSVHAVVFLVDSTDRERLELVTVTFDKVIHNDALDGLPLLMLANKQDVPQAMRVEDIKQHFNPLAMQLGARDSKVLPCVALTGSGVREAVEWLVLRIQRNQLHRPPHYQQR